MWKRNRMLGAAMTSVVILGNGAASAQAACSGEPVLPDEGLSWPAQGPVTRQWGLDCSTDRGHRGIDIGLAAGSPIRAAASGTVSFVGYTPAEGGGISVSIVHAGGLRSTYLHLANPAVAEGAFINQGETIGMSDGAPLHFGIKATAPHETYFDPEAFLPPPVAAQPPSVKPEPLAEMSPGIAPPATLDSPISPDAAPAAAISAPVQSTLAGTGTETTLAAPAVADTTGALLRTWREELGFRSTDDIEPASSIIRTPAENDGTPDLHFPHVMASGTTAGESPAGRQQALAAASGAYHSPATHDMVLPLLVAALLALLMARGRRLHERAAAQLALVRRLKLV